MIPQSVGPPEALVLTFQPARCDMVAHPGQHHNKTTSRLRDRTQRQRTATTMRGPTTDPNGRIKPLKPQTNRHPHYKTQPLQNLALKTPASPKNLVFKARKTLLPPYSRPAQIDRTCVRCVRISASTAASSRATSASTSCTCSSAEAASAPASARLGSP